VQQTVDLLKSVDGKHLKSDDGRTLDSATAATGLIEDLYADFLWPDLKQALSDLKDGDPEGIFSAADDYNNRSGGYYDGNGYEIYTAVTCDEGSLGTDDKNVLQDLDVIKAKAPALGFYAALDDTAALEVTCSNWPYPVATLPTQFDAPGAPPILVIGTTNDPATPYAQAVSLAKQLSSGVMITYHGEGHTVYDHGVSCIDDLVDAYFIDGTVPSADPMC
jgi:pimeloyl-ACP methyl ester carboxylesterase